MMAGWVKNKEEKGKDRRCNWHPVVVIRERLLAHVSHQANAGENRRKGCLSIAETTCDRRNLPEHQTNLILHEYYKIKKDVQICQVTLCL